MVKDLHGWMERCIRSSVKVREETGRRAVGVAVLDLDFAYPPMLPFGPAQKNMVICTAALSHGTVRQQDIFAYQCREHHSRQYTVGDERESCDVCSWHGATTSKSMFLGLALSRSSYGLVSAKHELW